MWVSMKFGYHVAFLAGGLLSDLHCPLSEFVRLFESDSKVIR